MLSVSHMTLYPANFPAKDNNTKYTAFSYCQVELHTHTIRAQKVIPDLATPPPIDKCFTQGCANDGINFQL